MKAVILSAGKGRRFRAINLPKSLTFLETGRSILSHQLEALSVVVPLDNIIVVVGYRKEQIIDQFPDLTYVYNPYFSEQNTSKSLLRALKKIENEDVLWLNGDVVFQKGLLPKLVLLHRNSVLVNKSAVGSEEVKYRSSNGKILAISKEIKDADGESLGVNFITKDSLEAFKSSLELCKSEDYFEKAIETCIASGVDFWSVLVGEEECAEVDFPEDLYKANRVISKK